MGDVRFYALVSSYLPVLLFIGRLVKFEVNSILYKINNYSHILTLELLHDTLCVMSESRHFLLHNFLVVSYFV